MRRGLRHLLLWAAVGTASVAIGGTIPVRGATRVAARNSADTLDAISRVRRLLRDRYGSRPGARLFGATAANRNSDEFCDGGEGSVCDGGDWDRGACPIDLHCHPTEEWLLEGLMESASEYPESGYLMGQAIYGLLKFGHDLEAAALVDRCQADRWWCAALRGYVLQSTGRVAEAEPFFREAWSGAPIPIRCSFGDALWLLGEWDPGTSPHEKLPEARRETESWACLDRVEISDTLFWLSDPLYSQAGNDRWTEHMARAMSTVFQAQIREAGRGAPAPDRDLDYDWATRIRRGPWDSYRQIPGGGRVRQWTSAPRARYHFVPDVSAGDLSAPVWHLEGGMLSEGYTPPSGTFHPVAVQIARFREEDSLVVAAAADLRRSPLRRAVGAEVHLILTDAPGSFPLRMAREVRRETPTFLGKAPSRRFVVSLEASTDIGIGWHRQTLSPLPDRGPGLSDLLLYDPEGPPEVDSLAQVVAFMLGSTTIGQGSAAGVFWEVYGVPAEATLQVELTLEREAGGLVDRLTGLFPGGARVERGRVAWSEPGTPETPGRGVSMDLGALEPGDYTLVLRVGWTGQAPMERRRRITVE